jgi:hypothetical protein
MLKDDYSGDIDGKYSFNPGKIWEQAAAFQKHKET